MLILLVLLIFFAALGIPLAFAIGASCVTYILIYAPTFITMLPQRVWNGAYSELMIAMPLFMLAGELMNTGGITQRIINFCMELLRPIRGGLGEVNIVASMIFGGISGSSVADTSALGSILIPAMEKEGYPPEASAGITVASSTMGMIIPPSTPMIVYSMISGASVGALFVAGAVPGILIGLTQSWCWCTSSAPRRAGIRKKSSLTASAPPRACFPAFLPSSCRCSSSSAFPSACALHPKVPVWPCCIPCWWASSSTRS